MDWQPRKNDSDKEPEHSTKTSLELTVRKRRNIASGGVGAFGIEDETYCSPFFPCVALKITMRVMLPVLTIADTPGKRFDYNQ